MTKKTIFTIYRPIISDAELANAIFSTNINDREFCATHENTLVRMQELGWKYNLTLSADSEEKTTEAYKVFQDAIKDGVLLPAYTVNTNHIEDIFNLKCPLDENGEQTDWTTRESVTILNRDCVISTVTVGDVVYGDNGEAWLCCVIGWKKVA